MAALRRGGYGCIVAYPLGSIWTTQSTNAYRLASCFTGLDDAGHSLDDVNASGNNPTGLALAAWIIDLLHHRQLGKLCREVAMAILGLYPDRNCPGWGSAGEC